MLEDNYDFSRLRICCKDIYERASARFRI